MDLSGKRIHSGPLGVYAEPGFLNSGHAAPQKQKKSFFYESLIMKSTVYTAAVKETKVSQSYVQTNPIRIRFTRINNQIRTKELTFRYRSNLF